jgi:hypothetical protein
VLSQEGRRPRADSDERRGAFQLAERCLTSLIILVGLEADSHGQLVKAASSWLLLATAIGTWTTIIRWKHHLSRDRVKVDRELAMFAGAASMITILLYFHP